VIVVGSPSTSTLVTSLQSGAMPLGGTPVSAANISLIQSWIANGAVQFLAPVVDAGIDQTVLAGDTLVLAGSATDVDGSISSYMWTQVSGPGTATLTNAATASVTLSALVAGTYVFQLQVTDSNAVTGVDTVTVTVTAPVSFATLNATIFTPQCVSCHSAALPSGGVNLSTYTSLVTQVVAGNAAGSTLYINVANGTMPPGGALTATQVNEILMWINQGAKNN
jgi:mono/diheme cytochrome c family protein